MFDGIQAMYGIDRRVLTAHAFPAWPAVQRLVLGSYFGGHLHRLLHFVPECPNLRQAGVEWGPVTSTDEAEVWHLCAECDQLATRAGHPQEEASILWERCNTTASDIRDSEWLRTPLTADPADAPWELRELTRDAATRAHSTSIPYNGPDGEWWRDYYANLAVVREARHREYKAKTGRPGDDIDQAYVLIGDVEVRLRRSVRSVRSYASAEALALYDWVAQGESWVIVRVPTRLVSRLQDEYAVFKLGDAVPSEQEPDLLVTLAALVIVPHSWRAPDLPACAYENLVDAALCINAQ